MADWDFLPDDPDSMGFGPPAPLANAALLIPKNPGVYVVSCGPCLAHVGTSGKLRTRVQTLIRLDHHRGSAEVLCAAFCTNVAPVVRWRSVGDVTEAKAVERRLKQRYGEPPAPSRAHHGCKNGQRLRAALTAAAGSGNWEAGYIDAVFDVGEDFKLLEQERFHAIWRRVGAPPGPWERRLLGSNE